MLRRSKKQSVYMGIPQNENGFTFLTLLVTLTIFCVTIPLASYLFKSVHYSTYQDEIAVQHCFQFLQDDLLQATDYHIAQEKITLTQLNDDKVTIEQYDNLIRRRVRGGNEIYLRDVKDVSFQKQPYGIRIRITTERGGTYEKTIFYYS